MINFLSPHQMAKIKIIGIKNHPGNRIDNELGLEFC